MTLDATPGSATANAYLTVEDADAIMAARLHNDEWAAASPEQKAAVLIWATRLFEALPWEGARETQAQALRWPRLVEDLDGYFFPTLTIPAPLKAAVAETALGLLREDRTEDTGATNLKDLKVGPVSLSFDTQERRPIGGIPQAAMDLVRPWIGGSSMGRAVRR